MKNNGQAVDFGSEPPARHRQEITDKETRKMDLRHSAVARMARPPPPPPEAVRERPADAELDASRLDLKTRIRLLQSKLHGSQPEEEAPEERLSCSSSGLSSPEELARSSSPAARKQPASTCCGSDDDDDLCSSYSSGSSSSSRSSAAPTPPPRFSSLAHPPEVARKQAQAGTQSSSEEQAGTKNKCNQFKLQNSTQSFVGDCNIPGDNKCAPLATHATLSQQSRPQCRLQFPADLCPGELSQHQRNNPRALSASRPSEPQVWGPARPPNHPPSRNNHANQLMAPIGPTTGLSNQHNSAPAAAVADKTSIKRPFSPARRAPPGTAIGSPICSPLPELPKQLASNYAPQTTCYQAGNCNNDRHRQPINGNFQKLQQQHLFTGQQQQQEAGKFNLCHPLARPAPIQPIQQFHNQQQQLQQPVFPDGRFLCRPEAGALICDADPLFGSSRRAPITKAVQEMVSQQQALVLERINSRQLLLQASGLPLPLPVGQQHQQEARRPANLLGSVSSASMSSISSSASTTTTTSSGPAPTRLKQLALRPLPPAPAKISATGSDKVQDERKYGRDSQLAEARRRRRRQRLLCARRAEGGRFRRMSQQQEQPPTSANNCDCETNDCECDSRKFAVCVVDKNGGHSLIKRDFDKSPEDGLGLPLEPAEFMDEAELALEELEELEAEEEAAAAAANLLLAGSSSCDFCAECQREAAAARNARPEMRGWPEELANCSSADQDSDELSLFDASSGELWPVARLQENPLASAASGSPVDDSAASALDRSRLLSMRQGQEQNRAAIRMISSDSVQLLVSASSAQAAAAAAQSRAANPHCLLMAAGALRQDNKAPPVVDNSAGLGELSQRVVVEPPVECRWRPASDWPQQVQQAGAQARAGGRQEQECALEAALARELRMQPARACASGLAGAGGRLGRPAACAAQQQQQQQQQRQVAISRSSVAAASGPQKTDNEKSPGASPSQRPSSAAEEPPSEGEENNPKNKNNNHIHCDVARRQANQETHGSQQNLLTTALELQRVGEARAEFPASRPAAREPVPTPRGQQQNYPQQTHHHQQQTQHHRQPEPDNQKTPLDDQLSILTGGQLNPRVRDISGLAAPSDAGSPGSILSDSALAADVAMNPSALIPKLIERLDRKLVVMKEEQLRLSKEIEANELAGQQLFDSMRRQLAPSEFEKISLHANEIEKVTKLILSLKLRLKKVEAELKERQREPTSQAVECSREEFQQIPTGTAAAAAAVAAGATLVRGVSDPTSTVGLPTKRNHQHHASLQLQPINSGSPNTTTAPTTTSAGSQMGAAKLAGSGSSSGVFGCSPRNSTELALPETQKANGNSNDSIFNCTDSAIGGSTLAGGSAQNLQQQVGGSGANSSSQSSLNSSACSPGNRLANHLSSSVSVSSHSSMSSVPHSPLLVSPASTSGGLGTSLSSSGASTPLSKPAAPGSIASPQYYKPQQNFAPNNNSNNSNTANCTIPEGSNPDLPDISIQPLTDFDILLAKRNKLVSQLEEAHQLEECILRRNGVIIQRILKKYYDEGGQGGGEIAEFKQFTRLKSLLLKDTHYVADRIDNAELQLTELRQTNLCNV